MIRLAIVTVVALCLASCATASPPPTPPAAPTAAPEPDDAFASFGGTIIPLGQLVTVKREPVGVKELRALIALGKTEWVIHSLPGGKEDKSATANLVVQRGEGAQNLRIDAGQSASGLGVTIEVVEAGEVYEEASMRWVQFAKIKVTQAP